MLYNDTNGTGICQEIDSLCGTNSTTYPLADKTRRLNSCLDDYFLIGMRVCGNWSIEDSGESDLPIATTALVSAQADYSLPSELLILETVEMLQSDGSTWVELTPIDKIPLNQASGTPITYKKIGNTIILSVTPNYNMTAGLKLHYRRAFNYATQTTGTFTPTTPGIPSIFHTWLARKASLPYLISKGLSQKNDIASVIQSDEINIERYFGERSRDTVRRLTPKVESCR